MGSELAKNVTMDSISTRIVSVSTQSLFIFSLSGTKLNNETLISETNLIWKHMLVEGGMTQKYLTEMRPLNLNWKLSTCSKILHKLNLSDESKRNHMFNIFSYINQISTCIDDIYLCFHSKLTILRLDHLINDKLIIKYQIIFSIARFYLCECHPNNFPQIQD